MLRHLGACLFVLALILGSTPAVVAQTDQASSAQSSAYPDPVNAANPYAQALAAAKTAYADARHRYDEAYPLAYHSWAHYQAYYRAYYDLWATYTRYHWYLQAYWWSERNNAFAGRVQTETLPGDAGFASPVQGATVQLMTYVPPGTRIAVHLLGTRQTNADGRFRFEGLNRGMYSYSVTKAGFAVASGNIEVRSGAPSLEIRIRRLRGVSGVVLARPQYGILPVDPPPGYLDPRPVSGARVSLYRTDVVYIRAPGPNAVATTDSEGRFAFDDAEFPRARVVVEMRNYATQSQNVNLDAGPVTVRFVLQYSGPPVPIAADPTHDGLNMR